MKTRPPLTTTTAVLALGIGILSAAGGFATGRTTAPTPQACLTALEDADQIIDLTSEALTLAGDGIVSAATWDTAGLEHMEHEVGLITKEIDGIDYVASKTDCQGVK